MDADLTVLDRDVLAEGAEALLETRVAATIVGGRVVYRAADR
jgi:predicted amidohydrolase YtcJ